jgi:hypothetical protein
MCRVGFAIVVVLFSFRTLAQFSGPFDAYDCRAYAEDLNATPLPELVLNFPDSLLAETVVYGPAIVVDTIDGWKSWSAVENYSFGKDRGSLEMITDLNALHPFFRDRVKQLIDLCKKKGIDIAIVETYRTHAKQHEYKTMGRKYTSSSAGNSRHQYGLAVDVVPIVDSVAVWDNTVLWRKIGVIGERIGLRWGGRWRKPFDPGHFEWTGGLSAWQLKSGQLPVVPEGEERYPCLTEDLRLLRKYWSEWETSQSSLTRK